MHRLESANNQHGRPCSHCDNPTVIDDILCSNCGQVLSVGNSDHGTFFFSVWESRVNRFGAILSYLALGILMTAVASLSESESLLMRVSENLLLFFTIGVMISRVHDIGKPGRWAMPWIGVGLISVWYGTPAWVFLYSAVSIPYSFWPGDKNTNQWGPSGIGFLRYWGRIVGRQ